MIFSIPESVFQALIFMSRNSSHNRVDRIIERWNRFFHALAIFCGLD